GDPEEAPEDGLHDVLGVESRRQLGRAAGLHEGAQALGVLVVKLGGGLLVAGAEPAQQRLIRSSLARFRWGLRLFFLPSFCCHVRSSQREGRLGRLRPPRASSSPFSALPAVRTGHARGLEDDSITAPKYGDNRCSELDDERVRLAHGVLLQTVPQPHHSGRRTPLLLSSLLVAALPR